MTTKPTVMIIDDDADILSALSQNLQLAGYAVECFSAGTPALAALTKDFAGVVLSDLRMPLVDGREVLRRIQLLDSQIPVVLMSAHADIGIAMQAMRNGAYDFITKPFDTGLLQAALRRASEWRRAILANRELNTARDRAVSAEIIAESSAAQAMLRELADAARTDLPCLITGEAGSGASSAARELHRLGAAIDAPLVVVDCPGAALAGAESYLFGHASGAFPGATMPRTGEIERANRGTLVLDRVDGLPPALQSRMIRLLESGDIVPLGSDLARPVKTRCVGIAQASAPGALTAVTNASLLYKLGATRLHIPPLRERRADIEPLFRRFFAAALAKSPPGAAPPNLGPTVWSHLAQHHWPGNLIELAAFAQLAVSGGSSSKTAHSDQQNVAGEASLRGRLAEFEAAVLRQALQENGGEARLAAAQLALPRKTFYERLARYGIVASNFRT